MIIFLQGYSMSIKEYFRKRKEEARKKAEYNKIKKALTNDKKSAEEILKAFNFVVKLTPKNGNPRDAIIRIIDEHNLEYCFIPEIWNTCSTARKMAIMIKFSEKHNKYPLRLDDFEIPTDAYKQQERMMHLIDLINSDKLVVDYDTKKMSNSISVLAALLGYEEIMKERIFLDDYKTYKSLLDFKSIEELKYFIGRREDLFATYFEDVNHSSKKQFDIALNQYKDDIDERATMHAVEILKNVAYYAEEANRTINFCEAFTNYWAKDRIENINRVFGGEDNLKRQTIKFAYDVFYKKLSEKDIDLQTATEHFMKMKEQDVEHSMFPSIELPTREQQQKQLSKFSLEL